MMEVTRKNFVICEDIGNAEENTTPVFLVAGKTDDRLSKDNLKYYKVRWVYGGGESFDYPKISLKVDDVVLTEALGIDITYQGKPYKIFDTEHIVSKVHI